MNSDIRGFDNAHPLDDSATSLPVPRSSRHAALLGLPGISPPRPRALPGTPITALARTFNYRFQVESGATPQAL
jgi:hypothetical protein